MTASGPTAEVVHALVTPAGCGRQSSGIAASRRARRRRHIWPGDRTGSDRGRAASDRRPLRARRSAGIRAGRRPPRSRGRSRSWCNRRGSACRCGAWSGARRDRSRRSRRRTSSRGRCRAAAARARVDLDGLCAGAQRRRSLLLQRPDAGIGDIGFVVEDGGEEHRDAALVRRGEEAARRRDLGVEVRAERPRRIGEGAEQVDDEEGRPLAEADRDPEPRCRKNSSSSLPLVTTCTPRYFARRIAGDCARPFTCDPFICEQSF